MMCIVTEQYFFIFVKAIYLLNVTNSVFISLRVDNPVDKMIGFFFYKIL